MRFRSVPVTRTRISSGIPLATELVALHYDVKEPCHTVSLHRHPFFQFDVFPSGMIDIHIEGRQPIPSSPWTALLIPPMTGHGYRIKRKTMMFSLKFHMHPRYWLQFDRVGLPVALPVWSGDLLKTAYDAVKDKEPMNGHLMEGAIAHCLSFWLKGQGEDLRRQETHAPWGNQIRLVLELLAKEPDRIWSVAELAKLCEWSPDHFRRRFEELVGRSPGNFIVELRMRTAANRLLNEDLAIKEVARELGYASVHGFTKAFTGVFGVSPAAYLKTLPQNM